jgi:PIN domain nuclease of toxin-antitoxin system
LRILADTHSLVWGLSKPSLLGTGARSIFRDGEVVASVASLWELCLKTGRRTGLVAEPIGWWARYVTQSGITAIPISESHVLALATIGNLHGDPFDRILIAQAIVEKLPLVTKDAKLARYGIQTIW